MLSIKDFFTSKMLKYAIMPFILTTILMYIIFFVVAGYGLDQLALIDFQGSQTYVQDGIAHTETLIAKIQASDIIQFLMSYAVTSWIATFLVYAIGGFLTIYVSIFVAVIIVGFLTPLIVKELHKRHYQDVEMKSYANLASSLILVFKWTSIMVLLFFLLIPFYFIPVLNIIAFNLPLYYFFHKMLTFDVSSNICDAEEAKQIGYFAGNTIRLKTLALYLISLIPFAIFFGAIFYVIYIAHTYFDEVKKLRAKEY
jgi:hypothetical protein